jgi:nucleoside transporter
MTPGIQAPRSAVSIRLSVMMFLQFFVWGAWYVSMTGWMNEVGIGGLTFWAYTVGPIAAVISPFFLGIVADRLFPVQVVLGALHILGGVALVVVPEVVGGLAPGRAMSFSHPYVLLLLAHMLCYMPTLGLSNSLSFHNMDRPERQFPIVRVFGTVGWIVGNIVVSGSLKPWGLDVTWIEAGDKSPVQFYVAGGAAVLLGLYAFSLPHTPPPSRGKKVTVREVLGLDSLVLLKRADYMVFVICSFLICIPLAAYYSSARNFVAFAGFGHPTLTMSYGQMSEILFMILMPLCFARLGVKWMLAAGMLAWVARYGLFAGAADQRIMSMVVLGVLLHGICYDFFFVAGSLYVDRIAPREIRSQAQGFLVLITQGLGLGVGAQLIGELNKATTSTTAAGRVFDWQTFWLVPAAFAAVVLVAFVSLFKDKTGDRAVGVFP